MSWKRKLLPNWNSFYIRGDSSFSKKIEIKKFQKTICCSVMGLVSNDPALEQPGKRLRKGCPSYLLCLRIQVEAFSSKYLVFILLQTFASFSCYVCVLCDYKYSSVISKTKVKKGAWHLKYLDFCIFISVILFLYRHLLDKYSNKLSKTKITDRCLTMAICSSKLMFM